MKDKDKNVIVSITLKIENEGDIDVILGIFSRTNIFSGIETFWEIKKDGTNVRVTIYRTKKLGIGIKTWRNEEEVMRRILRRFRIAGVVFSDFAIRSSLILPLRILQNLKFQLRRASKPKVPRKYMCPDCSVPLKFTNYEYVCPECGWVIQQCNIQEVCSVRKTEKEPETWIEETELGKEFREEDDYDKDYDS